MDEPDGDPVGLLPFIAKREGAIARIERELSEEQERMRTCDIAIEDLEAAIPQARIILTTQEENLRSLKEIWFRSKDLGVIASVCSRGISRSNARDKLRAHMVAPGHSADIQLIEKQVTIQANKVWDIRNSIRESELELDKWKELRELSASLVEHLLSLKHKEKYSHGKSAFILRNYIAKVPTNVWRRIFEIVVAHPPTDPKAARLGQVCKLWRHIMKGSPNLLMKENIWIARQKAAFVGSRRETFADSKPLVQGLDGLNLSIQELSYKIVSGLDVKFDALKVESRHYNAARKAVEDSSFLDRIEKFNFSPIDILDPIIRSILCTDLFRAVFKPFAPGLTPEESDRYVKLYTDTDVEGQRQYALRRSEYYEEASQANPYVCSHTNGQPGALQTDAKYCMAKILKVLDAFAGTKVDTSTRVKHEQAAIKIFERAVHLQRKAKTEYMKYDYDIFSSDVGDEFEAYQGEATQGLPEMAPRVVWLCVGLGMEAYRDGLRQAVCVKALVICNNWDPIC